MSQAVTEPITLAEAKLFLRIDHEDEDGLIGQMITAVRAEAENRTRRVFVGEGAEELPSPVRQWMLCRLSSLYEQRESFATGQNFVEFSHSFIDGLLDPYVQEGGF